MQLSRLFALLLTAYSVAGNNHLEEDNIDNQRQLSAQAGIVSVMGQLCTVMGVCNQLTAPGSSYGLPYSSYATPAPYSAPATYMQVPTSTPAPYVAPYATQYAPSVYTNPPTVPIITPAPYMPPMTTPSTYSAPPSAPTYSAPYVAPAPYMAPPSAPVAYSSPYTTTPAPYVTSTPPTAPAPYAPYQTPVVSYLG